MATVDALVIGRKTFETVLAFDTWPYGEKPVFVLSARPLAARSAGGRLERMTGEPADIVSQLATRGIGHIYVDGGITIQTVPAGRPHTASHHHPRSGTDRCRHSAVCRGPAGYLLRHVGTRQYASGLVQSEYVIA